MVEYQIGEKHSTQRRITNEDILKFAELSGDKNPIHLDEEYARATRFRRRIAHGFLYSSLFSALFGMNYTGSVYMEQTLKFLKPVFVEDEILAEIELLTLRTDRPIATFRTTIRNAEGKTIVEGQATLLLE